MYYNTSFSVFLILSNARARTLTHARARARAHTHTHTHTPHTQTDTRRWDRSHTAVCSVFIGQKTGLEVRLMIIIDYLWRPISSVRTHTHTHTHTYAHGRVSHSAVFRVHRTKDRCWGQIYDNNTLFMAPNLVSKDTHTHTHARTHAHTHTHTRTHARTHTHTHTHTL